MLVYTKQSDALKFEPLELIKSIQILESHQIFPRFHASGYSSVKLQIDNEDSRIAYHNLVNCRMTLRSLRGAASTVNWCRICSGPG